MQVNIVYDQALTSLPTGLVTAVNYVVNYFNNLFTNNVTINVALGYGEVAGSQMPAGSLGASLPSQYIPVSYGTVKTVLQAEGAPGASSLPTTSPLAGNMYVPVAEAKALGLAQNTGAIDGYVGVSSSYQFSYSPTATPAAGQYDFIGVLEHEITELMGRTSFSNLAPNFYSELDLFRYSAPGVRSTATGPTGSTSYFSVDNGATNLGSMNNHYGNGDLADWYPIGPAPGGKDAFNDYSSPAVKNVMGATDITLMQALGWTVGPQKSISVAATTSEVIQGGAPVALLKNAPTIADSVATSLTSVTVTITNGSGNPTAGDKLSVNGQQSGTVAGGLVTVTWNDSAKTLTLSGDVPIGTYQTLLGGILFQDSGSDASTGSHPVRTVTWTVNDGTTVFNTTSQITVDRAPVVADNASSDLAGATVSVPSVVGLLHNASDADGDALTVTGVSNTAHGAGTVGQALAGVYGQLTLNSNGSYSYTANNQGAIDNAPSVGHLKDTFTYTVGDSFGGNASASLTITLDRAPVVANNSANVVAGTTVTATAVQGVLSNASDADNDGISVTGVSNAANNVGSIGQALMGAYGQLTLNANGSYSYSATNSAAINSGAIGSHLQDTFKYTVSDGLGGNTSASLTVTLDRAPVVTASKVTLSDGQTSVAVASLVGATDADGDVVKGYQLSDATNDGGYFVVNGVVQSANQIYVTAAQLANTTFVSGAVTNQLYVQAFDGSAWSPSQGFTVSPSINTPPVVPDTTVSSLAGATITATAAGGVLSNASDANADTLVVTGVSDAAHGGGIVGQALAGVYGQLTLNSNGSYSYTANNTAAIGSAQGGSHLQDTFSYTVSDGHGGTNAASMTILLDRAPVVANSTVWDAAGAKATATAATGLLKTASDADGDALIVSAVSNVSHGGGTVGQALTGVYGELMLNADGAYSYNANNTSAINAAPSGSHIQDTFSYQVSDGHGGTTAATATFIVDRAPVATNSVASNIVGKTTNATVAQGVLSGANDADGDTLVITAVKSGAVAGTVGQAVAGMYGQLTLKADGSYSYNANNTAAITSAPAGVHLHDTFSYTVDDGHGGTAMASLTVSLDRAPVIAASNAWLDAGQTSVSAASLFSISDKDGDAIKAYQLYDATNGGGHFVINGVTQAEQPIYISAAQLAQTSFQSGTIADQIYVSAFDGTAWASWQGFQVTPWASDFNISVKAGASVTGALHQATAINGAFFVTGLSDLAHGAGSVGHSLAGAYGNLTINSDGSYNYTADNAAAINAAPTGVHLQDTFSYTASDGNGATATASLSVTLNRAPITTVADVSALPGPVGVSSLFSTYDADGDSIKIYQLNDATPGSGHWLINGIVQTAQNISVSAAQLAQTTYQSGPLSDSIYVSVFDGQSWSSWNGFKVNSVISHGDSSVVIGQAVSGVLDHPVVVSDDGAPFFSLINGSLVTGPEEHSVLGAYGLLTLNDDGSYNYNADNLAAISSAPTGSHLQDNFTYATGDGQGGSTATSLTITLDRAPVTAASDVTTEAGHSLTVASLFTASDADGDTIQAYQVSDTTAGAGHFVVDGVAQDAQQIYLTAAQMAQATFESGSGTDQLYVSAFDGTAWSAWQGLKVTGVTTASPGAPTVLDGQQGNQTVIATSGPTTLIGGPNDVLTAGSGADTFMFNQNFGVNTINGFAPGNDVIQFDHSIFANAYDVLSHLYQVGADALIVQDDHNLVTLHNVQVASLHVSDFHVA